MKFDIIIAGVGGQGAVLASRLIAAAALLSGLQARTSETIGMAQREGTVVSHVRFGDSVPGALIPDGGADVLLGFELAEAARAVKKLCSGGTAIVSNQKVIPVSVSLGLSEYNVDAITGCLEGAAANFYLLDAAGLAAQAGNPKTVNVVMVGALCGYPNFPLASDAMLEAIRRTVPRQYRDINELAFNLGLRAMEV